MQINSIKMLLTISIVLLMIQSICTKSTADPNAEANSEAHRGPRDPSRPSCACTREYFPICASNGVTYGNRCQFRCAAGPDLHLTYRHFGHCDEEDDQEK